MSHGKITYLDGFRLHRGLMAGIRQVISQEQHLNKINVFPVPDGDTGTNLSFTLSSIIEGVENRVEPHAGRTAVAIADAALDGARGNSGVILAQFFQGFSDACAHRRRLTIHHFTHAMQAGYEYALQALSEPKEGTILSVIRAAAEDLKPQTEAGMNDFIAPLNNSLIGAEKALKETPAQLAILKKRGVVDAGGQGFVYILRGALDFIREGSIRDNARIDDVRPVVEVTEQFVEAPEDSQFRYCTECMITGPDIRRNKLREDLQELGNSLVLGGSKERAKVHIHTNDPQAVFAVARTYGQLTGEKVDDMHRQVAAARSNQGRVAVVTDSTADIPAELIEAYNIHVVPVRLNFGNIGYLDKVTITPDEFFVQLVNSPHHPQTSQPTPGDFWRTYHFLSSHYASIVSLHLPRPVSGTLQSAENATQRLPKAKITVLDGLNTAVGLGLIVTRTAQAAKDGKSHEEVVAIARKAIEQTVIYAAVQDLSYAVKGGRVTRSRKVIADLLRATPVLSITRESTVDMAGIFFGRRDIAKGLAKWTATRIDRGQTYNIFVSHAQCPEAARRLVDLLPDLGYQFDRVHITETGAAMGAHTGPGSLILALQPAGLA